ncbi:hypothetical protein NDU88_010792, partial [Pleurodeles waltl]
TLCHGTMLSRILCHGTMLLRVLCCGILFLRRLCQNTEAWRNSLCNSVVRNKAYKKEITGTEQHYAID